MPRQPDQDHINRPPAGLLDEMEIHLVPVLLGGGRSLVGSLGPDHIELGRRPAAATLRQRLDRLRRGPEPETSLQP
jgi:hypothetical protein